MSLYNSEEDLNRSPGLQAVVPRTTPSPPPSLIPISRRHWRRSRRRPNYPDIARKAVEAPLNQLSQSEESDSYDEMSEGGERRNGEGRADQTKRDDPTARDEHVSSTRAMEAAAKNVARQMVEANKRSATPTTSTQKRPFGDGRGAGEFHDVSRTRKDYESAWTTPARAEGLRLDTGSRNLLSSEIPRTKKSSVYEGNSTDRAQVMTNGSSRGADLIATSPRLREHTISPSSGTMGQVLPALQNQLSPGRDGSIGSAGHEQTLPSFREISNMAEAASNENQARTNGYQSHPSFSPGVGTGPSPTLVTRPYTSNLQISPTHRFTSIPHPPTAMQFDTAANEPHSKLSPLSTPPVASPPFSNHSRQSQASESGPSQNAVHTPASSTTTTTDTVISCDTITSSNQSTVGDSRRPNIDGPASGILPHHPASTGQQHMQPPATGGFKCDYPGCNAAPFATQYLLNSHANVHSQDRPHYCPVSDCPRAKGGRGFKRKNEMIRHGLVHDSPGYVCPFCPDREHRYPRPDNLQRHVRVHHVDKEKDDPLLRAVLAQRPEGGSRNRRRRVAPS